MTIGGLYVIDGTLWQLLSQRKMCGSSRLQKRAQPRLRCRTEGRNQLQLWTTRIAARRKPFRLTTREQVKSSIQKKCERDEPKKVRELHEVEVKMYVNESEMQSTPGKKIWLKWVETRKDPNRSAIRCRLCAAEMNTAESRSDTFAATPLLKFVRLVLTWAASYKPKQTNASMIIAV